MRDALVVDIETVPLDDALEAPYPAADRSPPANYKSDEAIARWRASDEAAWRAARVKAASLNPRECRVVCVGLASSRGEEAVLARTAGDERAALRAFWDAAELTHGRVVTWNGSWDLRVLLLRSIHHQLSVPFSGRMLADWFRKYATVPHFDCKAVLTQWDAPRAGEGLQEWATFLGLPGKSDGLDGSMVYAMVQEARWDELAGYCMADVRATRAVFETIAPYFS
jgi:hypothetical protein